MATVLYLPEGQGPGGDSPVARAEGRRVTAGVYRVSIDAGPVSSGGNVTLTSAADLLAYLAENIDPNDDLPDQIVVARLYDVDHPERVD